MTHPMSKHMREIAADPDTMPCDAENCTEWAAELDRLHAIVEELPKTKDGVTITPGMKCWQIAGVGTKEYWRTAGAILGFDAGYERPECAPFHWGTYSTEQAARDAAEGDDQWHTR